MRTLKAYLFLLVIGVVLPGLVFGLGTSRWLAAEMHAATERQAQHLVAQVADDIAEHIRAAQVAMKVLARSPALVKGDFADAHQFASQLAADLGHHIGLATPDGVQLFNTRKPFGDALPPRSHPASYERALATGQPSVSDVIIGAIVQRPLVTIDIPVAGASGPLVLGTSTDVDTIAAVMTRTKLDPGWKVAVVDGEGRFIARNPEQYVGQLATPQIIAAAKSDRHEGQFRARTHDGEHMIAFFHRVSGTDWTVLVGTPLPLLLAPLDGRLAVLTAAGIGCIVLTLLVALAFGWRLDLAARRLNRMAVALGRGEEPLMPEKSIAEFEQVGAMLVKAAQLIREKQVQLTAAGNAAERSAAAKNRFFAAASHDLRQPLQASGLFLDTLSFLPLAPRQKMIVEQLGLAHASMSNLVGALLDIAKIDAGSLVPEPAPVELAQVIDDIVAECRPLAAAKGLELRFRRGRSTTLVTDRLMLGRILRNLVHNAIRYTGAGGLLVAVRRRGDQLVIEIWDTGIGIAPDQLDLIWEEFFQVGEDRCDNRGLGLGLAIVWRLAKLLGYLVEVRSRPGRGSVFRLCIPV